MISLNHGEATGTNTRKVVEESVILLMLGRLKGDGPLADLQQ